MKSNTLFFVKLIFVILILSAKPDFAFCELKSLDDAELSTVEAEGVTVSDVNNPSDAAENSGILSVTAGDSDPLDLNDPNSAVNVLRPQTLNNNAIAAPQNQFNNLNQSPSCCSGRSGCP
ncbi:MAG: hypothetical protein MUE70_15665 [Desulfobacterales bacterium]|jgi:hypothetical protein|nr:hypothetical protein [Desulfobacterales bacterium]